MAVQLILKNSSVEDRHPTANQLTNGEISLNYNEAGAFLSCRDTNGDIQHIGGVKIDDATPGSPSKQALWFQPSTSKLFIYDGTGWLVVASGGGSGPGSDTVDQILAGNGINADPSTGLGVITLDADLNFSRGLEFVAGQIAVALGVGLEFDVNGRVANTLGAVQYRGTLDLTSSDPRPTSPVQGDTWVNTADGTSNAVWNPDIPTGTTVEVGDIVIYNGTIWTFLARGLSPAERTDLGLGVVDDVSVEVTSSTGSNVQLPAATGTTAGVLTAADKVIIDEGASTWERNGSILQPVDDTYDVEVGGGNITLASAGGITCRDFTLSKISNPRVVIESPGDNSSSRATTLSYEFSDGGGAAIQATRKTSETASDVYLSFRTGGTTNSEQRMVVGSTGDVLIGGTLPSAPNITLAEGGAISAGTYNTLTVDSPATNSTAVGIAALESVTTGGTNVALGNRTLRLLTTGSNNVAVGYQALTVTNGSNNTVVGNNALNQLTTGGKNCVLGSGALSDNISGNFNVAIGHQSGKTFTGGSNTILGAYPGTAADSTLSNTVVISAGVNERLRINSTGDVGIGTTDPNANLHVASLGGASLRLQDSSGTGGVNSALITADGTTALKLQASGGTTGKAITFFRNSNAEAMRIGSTGDVLIGGTLPSAPNITLASSGAITAGTYNTVSIFRSATGNNIGYGTNSFQSVTSGVNNAAYGNAVLNNLTSGINNVGLGNSSLSLITEGDSNVAVGVLASSAITTGSENIAIGKQALRGNVIGSSNTAIGSNAGFFIEGDNNTILGAYKGTTADSTLNDTVIISAGATERLRINSVGDVGIGTNDPQTELEVVSIGPTITSRATSNSSGKFATDNSRGADLIGGQVLGKWAGNTVSSINFINGSDSANFGNGAISFSTSSANSNTVQRLYIGAAGDVLIGGTLPSAPNITLNSDGSATFAGKLVSASTVSGDTGTTLVTKDYVDSAYPGIPQNAQTSAYTLVSTDNGKHISITTGGVTVPSDVFSVGDTISIYNNSAADQTITQGASVTLRSAGTADTGNRTLAQRGLATVLCVGNNEFVISGGGLS